MENSIKNRNIAETFTRYLERRFGWRSKVVMPEQVNNHLFDASLEIDGGEILLFQLKQNIKFESEEKILINSKIKIYGKYFTEDVVKKAEGKYKDKAEDLILILHDDYGIRMPWDAEPIQKSFKTKFRGVYLVSPEQILYGPQPDKIEEFVSEIKNAFA